MSVHTRLDLEALDGRLDEADLLARLADAVLDYVADGYHARDAAGVCGGHTANPARTPQAYAGCKQFAETDPQGRCDMTLLVQLPQRKLAHSCWLRLDAIWEGWAVCCLQLFGVTRNYRANACGGVGSAVPALPARRMLPPPMTPA